MKKHNVRASKREQKRSPDAGVGRRKFMKQASNTMLAAAGGSAVPGVETTAAQQSGAGNSATFDWISVGAGAAGMAAAIAGYDLGLKTLLLEKLDLVGGVTAHSGGVIWAPINPLQSAAGIKDTREEAEAYLEWIGGGLINRKDLNHYISDSPRTIEYLTKKADVKFYISELPDFYPGAPGAKERARALLCEPFPAATLGTWRSKLRLATHYHGFQDALEEMGWEHNPALGSSLKGASKGELVGHDGPVRGLDTLALRLWKKRLGSRVEQYMNSDEENRVSGAALSAHLFRAVLNRGIEVRLGTSAEKLLVENGRVVGVIVINREGREEAIKANKGVFLGTGPGNGTYLAAAVGARLDTEATLSGGAGFQVPDERWPNGVSVDDPYNAVAGGRGSYEQRMRHGIVVNRFGERFAGEGRMFSLQEHLRDFDQFETHRFRNVPNYFIFDQQLIEKYSFAGRPPGETEGLEWVAQAKTIGELARKLGLPPAKLEATVERYNQNARRKEDPDFHRPAATVGPLEKAPFYGLKHREDQSGPWNVDISVVVNDRGQVLHYKGKFVDNTFQGEPIPGLYAGGQRSWIETDNLWGVGYQAGFDLMFCLESGIWAAEHAAERTVLS